MMSEIAQNLQALFARIAIAAEKSARSQDEIRLLAVSKTKPSSAILAAIAAGQRAFGESYVQEAVAKIEELRQERMDFGLEWHFIGPLQSNKSRLVAEHFDWVQSVDRVKLIERLNEQRPIELPPLNICLQINISHEESKSGALVSELPELLAALKNAPRLRLRGLMAIPEHTDDSERLGRQLAEMSALFQTLQRDYPEVDTLSLGMSEDLESAIAHGSTMVRVGSAIFGARS